METKVKNRGWVKNAIIVFLVILLLLTFFSNTIMNRSLAEVATKSAGGASITARIRGTGTVTAAGSYEVKAAQTREIRSVMVRVGQEVRQGDVLFVLGEGDSDELEKAKEELRQLELNRARTAAASPSYDYSLDEYKIGLLSEQLDAAREKEALAYLAMENNGSVPAYEINEARARIDAAQSKLDNAQLDLLTAQDDFALRQQDAQARVDQALYDLNWILDNPEAFDPDDTEEGKSEYQRALDEAQAALAAAQTAQAALDPSTDPGILDAQQRIDDAQRELDQANQDLDAMMSEAGTYAEAYAEALAERQDLEGQLFALQYSLNQQKISDGKAASSTYFELQEMDYQIEQAREKIENLSGGEEDRVLANVDGIIETVCFTAGNTPAKGETLATIQVPDLGYTLSFSVTSEQARRLHVGDTATPVNYYGARQIDATLSSIRPDAKNPQNSRILTFDLHGDVNPGSELTLAVGSKSQYYDMTVPNSAIRSDTNGSFVLVVESRNSPLGNRYYAKRVDVMILAEDDANTAVSGELGWGDFVITTSSKPIKNGDMVRMPD